MHQISNAQILSIKQFYLLGIGGIGMSALARYLKSVGHDVSGYDRVRSELCVALEKEGMPINYIDSIDSIPTEFNKESTQVIYTPAIPFDSPQLNYFKAKEFTLYKRSQLLGLITENSFNISIAGTHGKTTTSCLIAHLLHYANLPFAAFLGGISSNLGSNYINTNTSENLPTTVTEADEYDRSFLTLSPNLAIVTSMDEDHLDIYETGEELKKSFFDFINKIKKNGTLFLKDGLECPSNLDAKIIRYGIESGDYRATNIAIKDRWFTFDFESNTEKWTSLKLGIQGIHNIENSIAAIAVCLHLKLPKEKIIQGLKEFKGVKRRFEYISNQPNFIFIDDYAHHPTEIEAFIKSVKMLYPNEKITGIFQPHLYSRTKDFADDFAKSLSQLDVSILLNIYPARELPIEGITSSIIHKNITSPSKFLLQSEELLPLLTELKPTLILTMGAGDIDTMIHPIKILLES